MNDMSDKWTEKIKQGLAESEAGQRVPLDSYFSEGKKRYRVGLGLILLSIWTGVTGLIGSIAGDTWLGISCAAFSVLVTGGLVTLRRQ